MSTVTETKAEKEALDKFEKDNAEELTREPDKKPGDKEPDKKDDKTGEGDEKSADELDDDTVSDERDEDAGDEEEGKWLSSETALELLESLELDETDLENFKDLDELQRHADLIDKQAYKAGKAATKPGDEQEAVLKAQEAIQAKLEAQERATARKRDNGRFTREEEEEDGYKPDLDPDVENDDIIGEFKRLGGHTEKRMQRFQEQLDEFRTEREEFRQEQRGAAFNAIADTLGEEKLLGTHAAPKQKVRARLQDAVEILQGGLKSKGRSTQVTASLLKRALNLEFADELKKQDRESFNSKVRKQSKKKTGSGSRTRPKAGDVWKGAPEDDPELHALHAKMLEEGGG